MVTHFWLVFKIKALNNSLIHILLLKSTQHSNQGAPVALAEGARQSVEGQLPSHLSSTNNRDAATVSVPSSSVINEKKVQNLEEKLSAAEVEKTNLLKVRFQGLMQALQF